jgi:gliding motility-associated-like protein
MIFRLKEGELNMKRLLLGFTLALFSGMEVSGQSVQDCVGAIPVCQSIYTETNSYTGHGNIIDYVGSGSCFNNALCIDAENNSVWYTFQIQTSGILDFRLTPNGPNTDYDWAIFNLTNRNCSDLLNTSLYSQIIASCNAANSYGATGVNSLTPNTNTNCQGPSSLNAAPPNNSSLNVVAGQQYYLNIQNWTGSTAGYTLDFTNSTASIYDNIPPTLIHIDSNISCGATTITATFSENVLCNTVDVGDFTLTGPNGTHTITGVTGQICSQGGNQENTYVITISPPINGGGQYTLSLVDSITDLCGNVATQTTINFNVIQVICSVVDTIQPTCQANNGSIQVQGTQGSGNYTYEWNTTPVQNTATATGLGAGSYTVTVHDGVCSSECNITLNSSTGLVVTTSSTDTKCGLPNGTATVSATGSNPLTYTWSTTPVQHNQSITGLASGNYSISVTDSDGCLVVNTVQIGQSSPLVLNPIKHNESCLNYCNGDIQINSSTGTAPFVYNWSNNISTTSTVQNLCPGNYSVTVTDSINCTAIANVVINTNTLIDAAFSWSPEYNVAPASVSFTSNSTGASIYNWAFGDGNISSQQNPQNTFIIPQSYTVKLIVSSGSPDFCTDSIEQVIVIYEPLKFIIPNVFTPNGDGFNDCFEVQITGVKSEEMKIYNRWGRKIYTWTSLGGKWNGHEGAGEAPDGIYFYIFKATGFDNKVIEESGSVTIIR